MKKIMIVDDIPAMPDLVSEVLKVGHYELETACGGEECLGTLHPLDSKREKKAMKDN